MIEGIEARNYQEYRHLIWPFLENFASRDLDGMTAEEIEYEILDRRTQVWNINNFQAVALTRVTRDAVRLERCAGIRRHEWQNEMVDALENWARALGKKRFIGTIRQGWWPFAKERGYKEKHREVVRKL
ncbi:MAG: hypothetical protein AAFR21_11625 [Pseudomonadota bacterium]